MKNPHSFPNRLKNGLFARWSAEDYPGVEARFQIALFAKDIIIFILLPVLAVVFYKCCDGMSPARSKITKQEAIKNSIRLDSSKSQIIDFRSHRTVSALSGIAKRSPGGLVQVKLLNVVETYSNAPVHAQIVDGGLGGNLMGGTLIGDATPDSNFERINITFKFVRDPNRESIGVPISARALSLDGTLGIEANKKEGFFTRSAIGSAGTVSNDLQGRGGNSMDFKDVLIKALTSGLIQEFGSGAQVEKNRSQVLSLPPGKVFFAELTDFFPGGAK